MSSFRRILTTGILLAGPLLAAGGPSAPPTFAGDIAAILYANCATCHRPGEPAPFSLQSYADAFRKRQQIELVTRRGIMPPWLPSQGDFRDERRLSDDEIAKIRQWVAAGAPRGEIADEPEAPQFPEGWQLREPDLVLTVAEALPVAAGGPDTLHNLVLPHGLEELRYVEAVEIRPGSPAVHHAILALDSTREARQLDAQHPGPGFPGMQMARAGPPDGHFIGWTPGKQTRRSADGMAWGLRPGHDLVLQLHLAPTGKPESVRPRIGLYFTSSPTRVRPEPVVLYSEQIDIPAGAKDHVISDRLVLPVAAVLHSVYPHAHYLCRQMQAEARLPDGRTETLLGIDDWNFAWQDDYAYRQPIPLPAGTVLSFTYHYDNSEGNPANPHSPPRRVQFGQESSDEMGTLSLTVTVADEEQRNRLKAAILERDLEKKPWDWTVLSRLSENRRVAGRLDEAMQAARTALQFQPDYAPAHTELGSCFEFRGDLEAAARCYRAALRCDPEFVLARMHLGGILARAGHTQEAIAHFTEAIALYPNIAALQNNMATALFSEGKLERALTHYRKALALEPDYFNAQFNLGRVLASLGRTAEARRELQRALQLRPGDATVRDTLSRLPR